MTKNHKNGRGERRSRLAGAGWHRVCVAMSVAAAGATGIGTRSARADILFNNFGSVSGLSLNGSAAAVNSTFASGATFDGHVLRVAPSTTGAAGSAFDTSSLNVSGGFDTFFTFRIGSQDTQGFNGADGMTFTIQSQSPTALGEGGGYLGIGGNNTIAPSVSVIYDIFQNDSGEPSNNYIGLVTNGNLNNNSTHLANADLTGNPNVSLRDQQLVYTWIDYSGGILNVYASENGIRPATALISQSIDLSSFTSAYVGFTAASGGGTANFDVLNWDLNTNGATYGNIPGSPNISIHVKGVDGSNWNTPSTWQEAKVPTLLNNVLLQSNFFNTQYTLNVTDKEQAQSLHLTGAPGGEATVLVTGNSAELDVAAAIEVLAGNTITADSGGKFVGAPGARVNNGGTIQATNGGSIFFDANSYIDQTVGGTGVLVSNGPGSSIRFGDSAVVHSGTLSASGGGSIQGVGGKLTYENLYFDADLNVEAGLATIIHGPTTVTGVVLVEGQNALLSVEDAANLQATSDGGASWNTVTIQSDGLGNPGTFEILGSTASIGELDVSNGGSVFIQQDNSTPATLNVHSDLNLTSNSNLTLQDRNSILNVDGTLSVDSSSFLAATQSTISVGNLAIDPSANVQLSEINLYITGSRFVLDPDDGTASQVLADNGNPGQLTVDGNINDAFQLHELHVDFGTLTIGDNTFGDAAQLNIVNGGWVTAGAMEIGSDGSKATVNVEAGASLAVFGTLTVDPTGTLVASKASVAAGSLAFKPGAHITFTEVDFSLTNAPFYVDSTIGTAPQVFADNPLVPGVITVDGLSTDSHALHGLHVDNNTLFIGTSGNGTLNIIKGGFLSAKDISVGSHGTLTSTNGNITVQSLASLTASTGKITIVESGFNLNGVTPVNFVIDPLYGTDSALFADTGKPGTVTVDGNLNGTHVLSSLNIFNNGTLFIGDSGGASTLNVFNNGSVFAQNAGIGLFGDAALLNIDSGGIAQMNNLDAGDTATLKVGTTGALVVSGSSTLDSGSVVNSQSTVYFGHTVGDAAINVNGTLDSALIVVDANDPGAGTNGGYVNFNGGAQIGQNTPGDLQVNSGQLFIWSQTVNFNNMYVGEIIPDPLNPPQSNLNVVAGATVDVQGQLVVGDSPNSNSQFSIDGSGTALTTGLDNTMIGDTIFGRFGHVFATITGGAKLTTSGTGYVGDSASSNAYVIISGLDPNYPNGASPRAIWGIGGNLFIGNAPGAFAQIDVSSAGLLDVAGDIHMGSNGDGSGILNVFGYDDGHHLPSTVHSGGDLIVGDSGSGFIILHLFGRTHNGDGGGQVQTDGNGYIGNNPGSSGSVSVEDYDATSGKPSTWTINQDLFVGFDGSGQLNMGASPDGSSANGGLVDVLGNVHVGSQFDGKGQINLWGINPATGLRATLQVGGNLLVGESGVGVINIGTNDSNVTNGNPGSPLLNLGGGLVTVAGNLVLAGSSDSEIGIRFNDPTTGTPSTLDVTGSVTANNGVLSLYDNGLMNSGTATIGATPGTFGTTWVSTNSTWNVHGDLYVGALGGAFLSSWAGSNITVDGALFIGSNNDGLGNSGNGTVEVNNTSGSTNSTLKVGTFAEVGDFGTGALNIGSNGQVKTAFLAVAFGSGATGTINVIGTGASLIIANTSSTPGSLYVGQGYLDSSHDQGNPAINPLAHGYLYINSGGSVTDGDGHIGSENLGVGAVQVGTAGTWTNTSSLSVGEHGTGSLGVLASGIVTDTNGYIGRYAGATGIATVSGAGARWSNSGALFIAANDSANNPGNQILAAGVGTLTIATGGSVSAAAPSVIGAGGLLILQGGSYTAPSTTLSGAVSGNGQLFGRINGGSGTVTATGASPLVSDGITASRLIVNNSDQIRSNGSASGASKVSSLTLAGTTNAWTGKLDITNNLLVVEATPANKAAQLAQIFNQVANGVPGTVGIVSTTLTTSTAIAVVDNGTLGTFQKLTTFRSQPVDSNSIFVVQALKGDTNLDGSVNAADLLNLLKHYNTADTAWTDGNSTYNASVGSADLLNLLKNYNTSTTGFSLAAGGSGLAPAGNAGGGSSSPVPEPASLAVLALGGGALLARRRRR